MLASQTGKLVVISVIAALYPAITVLLARIFLKERFERHQVIGLYGAGVAIVLLTIS
jgi:drug/metabolite transporter (DMT)-like permease